MTRKVFPALLGVAAVSFAYVAAAQEENEEQASDEPVRCLSMNSIRSTKVLDDSRVLFLNARDKAWLNRLDRECLGLARSGTFEYRVQSGARHARLCSTDSITVIESTGRGLNCGLGMFEPLSPDELASLIGGPSSAITSAPVELPTPETPPAPPPK